MLVQSKTLLFLISYCCILTTINCQQPSKLNTILERLNQLEAKIDELRVLMQPQKCGGYRTSNWKNTQSKFLDSESVTKTIAAPNAASASTATKIVSKCTDKIAKICERSGITEISLDNVQTPIKVTCDANRWIIVLQRLDGSVHFNNQTWPTFKHGFGNTNEFFLGLQNLHDISSTGFYELRFELVDFEGAKTTAFYSDFSVGNEQSAFKLGPLGVYHGNAGDSFGYHEGQSFTTMDRDHDAKVVGNCGEQYNSAGWFKDCMEANIMGKYLLGVNDNFKEGMYWETFGGPEYSLKSLKMSIRAKC